MDIELLRWFPWFLNLDVGTQALLVGLPALFSLGAPLAYRWKEMTGVWLLWIGILLPLIPLGWLNWVADRTRESPNLPLFNIAIYALPVAAVTAVGAFVVRSCANRQQSLPRQVEIVFLAVVASSPVLMPLTMPVLLVIYGVTGGFI